VCNKKNKTAEYKKMLETEGATERRGKENSMATAR
jgi:hypothetical protein